MPPADHAAYAAHFILYVSNQADSAAFYTAALAPQPRLDVPGMTEYELTGGAVLGLMPEAGIKRLLGDALKHPATAGGAPRAELYLLMDNADAHHQRAVQAGAKELSPVTPRDWGHSVGYLLDPDGHVLAIAQSNPAVYAQ